MSLNLKKLEENLDKVLKHETPETLNKFLNEHSKFIESTAFYITDISKLEYNEAIDISRKLLPVFKTIFKDGMLMGIGASFGINKSADELFQEFLNHYYILHE